VFPCLAEHVILRNLEVPLLYDILNEDMWELDEEAFTALRYFTGTWSVGDIAKELQTKKDEIEDLIEDLGSSIIIDKHITGERVKLELDQSPIPSLRTILFHVTLVCNLNCRHCYLEKVKDLHISPEVFFSTVSELDRLQGLKLLISGGEPLLHPHIFEMLESLRNIRLRKMLLSNGTLIDEKIARKLKEYIHEVQISIDGTDSHNKFRNNPHAFTKSIQAIKYLIEASIDVSVATMIHSQNIDELPALEAILKDFHIKSWALDVPSQTGEFLKYPELYPSMEDAGLALRKYGWGAPFEDTNNVFACGAHLCAVMPNGDVSKCGFFGDKPVGNLTQLKLEDCWQLIQNKYIWKQEDLDCASLHCPYIMDCRGGCRFRAFLDTDKLYGIDRVKCAAFNFKYLKESDK
jgi:radical SAM protein with 4Fe4S-binding SPASM domain